METLESLPKDQLKNDYPRQVYPDPPYQPPEYLAYLNRRPTRSNRCASSSMPA